MKRMRLAAWACGALFLLLGPAARADLLFALDSSTNGDLPNKVNALKPYLTILVEDTGTDEVTITMDATNLDSENFLPFVLMNYDGDATTLSATTSPSQAIGFTTSSTQDQDGGNQVKAGLFNLLFDYETSNSGDRFSGGETAVWVLTGAGLKASKFALTSIDKPSPNPSNGGWYAAARVQGIQLSGGRTGSGSIGGDQLSVVPEPSSIGLAGLGVVALAGAALRRRRLQA